MFRIPTAGQDNTKESDQKNLSAISLSPPVAMPVIWFDFDNSPHVPVLLPIAREMRRRGYKTFFTARDVAQTVGLLEVAGEQHLVIDQIFPKQTVKKYYHTVQRARHLKNVIKYVKPDCSVSHCSRSAILGAWLYGIPSLTMFDYEYINTLIQNLFCTKVLIPEVVPDAAVEDAGINKENLSRYPGLKEQLYLKDFHPDPDFGNTFQIPVNEKVILTFRPPAENSHYHNGEVNLFTEALIKRIIEYKSSLFLILLPRTPAQKEKYGKILTTNEVDHLIPQTPLPGADLVYHSDVVITGGGTMVREAAVLGIPAYTIFRGKKGAVDQFLEQQGRLFFIDSPGQIFSIPFEKRSDCPQRLSASKCPLQIICEHIETLISTERKFANRKVIGAGKLVYPD